MSLPILLSLDFAIGGYIGMSGYLTYQKELESAVFEDELDEDDPYYNPDEKLQDVCVKAQTFERDLLCLDVLRDPSKEATSVLTPVFLGHGSVDEKVPLVLGEAAARAVKNSGYSVDWKCYEGQGHWYKVPDEVDDIVDFIVSKVGWKTAVEVSRSE